MISVDAIVCTRTHIVLLFKELNNNVAKSPFSLNLVSMYPRTL